MAFDKVQEEQGMALADFLRDFHEAPFELIHGRKVLWMPNTAGHTELTEQLRDILRDYLKVNPLGQVRSEGTFISEYRKDWVKGSLIPDVLFYAAERLEAYKEENPDWADKPYVLIPDLAIEVVSKNDSYSDINEKVGLYLELGVKEIWVLDPQAKNAYIHSPKKTEIIQKSESIKSAVLPNFELKLPDLFGEK